MKKLLLVVMLLTGCTAAKHPVVVNVPVKVVKVSPPAPVDIYLMCSGRLFKGVVVSVNGSEAVYKCPNVE